MVLLRSSAIKKNRAKAAKLRADILWHVRTFGALILYYEHPQCLEQVLNQHFSQVPETVRNDVLRAHQAFRPPTPFFRNRKGLLSAVTAWDVAVSNLFTASRNALGEEAAKQAMSAFFHRPSDCSLSEQGGTVRTALDAAHSLSQVLAGIQKAGSQDSNTDVLILDILKELVIEFACFPWAISLKDVVHERLLEDKLNQLEQRLSAYFQASKAAVLPYQILGFTSAGFSAAALGMGVVFIIIVACPHDPQVVSAVAKLSAGAPCLMLGVSLALLALFAVSAALLIRQSYKNTGRNARLADLKQQAGACFSALDGVLEASALSGHGAPVYSQEVPRGHTVAPPPYTGNDEAAGRAASSPATSASALLASSGAPGAPEALGAPEATGPSTSSGSHGLAVGSYSPASA